MPKTIRAKFTGGVFKPLERFDLEEDSEVLITIDAEPILPDDDRATRFKSAMGAWKGTHDPEELLRNIYSERLTGSRPLPKI